MRRRKEPTQFLDQWYKRGAQPQHLSRNVIHNDKWDKETYQQLLQEMQELHAAEDEITEAIPTGEPLFADTYYALSKADPRLKDPGDIRPSHLINQTVMEMAQLLPEFEDLREYSVGDQIGSALACVSMEPDLETIYDRLKTEQKMAEELAKQEQALEAEEKTAEQLMEELNNPDNTKDEQEQAERDFQKNQALINQLREKLAQGAEELQEKLGKKAPLIAHGVRHALKNGMKEVGDTEDAALAWGLERGALQRLDPRERLGLASKLNNPRLRRIADLIGAMKRIAFSEQMKKTVHARDEVYDLSMGNDLERVLPMELLSLRHPLRKYDFWRKYNERGLIQYELRGEEKVAKGGIICCEDGSGSMSGDPEMWAKAVSICLLNIAKAQNRPFMGIHFGSPNEYHSKVFRNPKEITFNDAIDWAEIFFGGGTDFVTPLTLALKELQEEHDLTGAVTGDIVFITDGMCGVPDEWLKAFKDEQARIKFRVYGIIIGGRKTDEPLATICDGRVLNIKDLQTGEEIRDIFRAV